MSKTPSPKTAPEWIRIQENQHRKKNWKRWGPYLAERQWGTVREDYSANGDSWNSFTHDQARSRAYRWGEDGLLGITDRQGRACFALALWNHKDPFLKERLFGLTGPEGNHGEDVKEQYFYLDSTPTHSYMKALYKYPQAEFPYQQLVDNNAQRSKLEPEYELTDTGVFDESRYFDVLAEYAKGDDNDVLIRISITNRGPDPAPIDCLPTLWCRNTWAHGRTGEGYWPRPRMQRQSANQVSMEHASLGKMQWLIEPDENGVDAPLLFTENETNQKRLFGTVNDQPYVKDAFHERVIHDNIGATHPGQTGSKAAAWFSFDIASGDTKTIRLRLLNQTSFEQLECNDASPLGVDFDATFGQRLAEANEFYDEVMDDLTGQRALIARQAYAGLLWTKQFYHYNVRDWLRGDPNRPHPPAERLQGRNSDWSHLANRDVISMPDKWEYPWYAAWDLAFHMIPFAEIDIDFAKRQLILFLREWFMHPSAVSYTHLTLPTKRIV